MRGHDGRGEAGERPLARHAATAPPLRKAASSTPVPKTDVFGTEPAWVNGPHQDPAGAGRLRAWGDGGVYLKLMFSVQEPAGFNDPNRTVLALVIGLN